MDVREEDPRTEIRGHASAARARSLERYQQDCQALTLGLELARAMPGDEWALRAGLMELVLDHRRTIIDCVENDRPFIAAYYCLAPELFRAMDLPGYMILEAPFFATAPSWITSDIEGAEEMGFDSELCTLLRLPMYSIENGLLPVPTAALGLLEPCDGLPMLHQMIRRNEAWRDVPTFDCDPPYRSDPRAISYFADQLKRMVEFLETHTGQSLDTQRLAEVCEESNRHYGLWQECNELRRSVPSPFGWEMGFYSFVLSGVFAAADPHSTAWFDRLSRMGERRLGAGEGSRDLPGWQEKIRLFWCDLLPHGMIELLPWLEERWGAVVVMDVYANFPYTLIDTSSEETMFRDLAKRNLVDVPMIRHGRSTADAFVSDTRRIVKDYKIDAVIWPGHVGHKDWSASTGIVRETCRELGVPFIRLGVDLWDRRYMSPEEVKDKLSDFFEGMGLG